AAWRDCELVAAAPSELIGMLRRGEVDVALASVIDGAGDGVVLLPVGMIGCDGPTLTVRVFSRVPIEKIRRVAVDSESHTSVVLLRVLMWRKFGVKVEVHSGGVEESRGAGVGEKADAVLLIGDKVVTDAPDAAEYPHQMDL